MSSPPRIISRIPGEGATVIPALTPSGGQSTTQTEIANAIAFPTRAAFIAALSYLSPITRDGAIYNAGGFLYVKSSGATAIADIPNWLPSREVYPQHFGAVGDGVNDDTTPLQRAEIYCRSTFRKLIGYGTYGVSAKIIALAPYIDIKLVVLDSFSGTYVVETSWQLANSASLPLPIDPHVPSGIATVRENQIGYHRIHIDGLHEPTVGNTAHQEIGFHLFGVCSPEFEGHYSASRLYHFGIAESQYEKQMPHFNMWKCRDGITIRRDPAVTYSDSTPSEITVHVTGGQCGRFVHLQGLGSARVVCALENTLGEHGFAAIDIEEGFTACLSGFLRGPNATVGNVYVHNGSTNPNYVHFEGFHIQVPRYSPGLVVDRAYGISGQLRVSESYAGVAVIKKCVGAMHLEVMADRSMILAGNGYESQPMVVLGDATDGDIRSGCLNLTVQDMRDLPKRKSIVVQSIGSFDANADNSGNAPLRAFRLDMNTDATDAGADILDPRLITGGDIVCSRVVNWRGEATFRTMSLQGGGMAGWISINDDAAVSFTPVRPQGKILIEFPGATARFAELYYNTGATLNTTLYHSQGPMAVQTGVLTGSTGTDGNFTVSVSGGKIYLENRVGSGATIFFRQF